MQIQNEREQPEVVSYKTIRRSIGMIGIMLPVVLLAAGSLFGCKTMMPSISHYYFTYFVTIFTGSLCAVGLFLFTYKGFGKLDDIATNLAGLCAFGIALFPTTKPDANMFCNIYVDNFRVPSSIIHYSFAGVFFVTLALISIFLFTQTKDKMNMTPEKKTRNKIYKTCGCLMILFVILVPLADFFPDLQKYNPTLWCEMAALWTFGFSWLTKGELIKQDK